MSAAAGLQAARQTESKDEQVLHTHTHTHFILITISYMYMYCTCKSELPLVNCPILSSEIQLDIVTIIITYIIGSYNSFSPLVGHFIERCPVPHTVMQRFH